MHFVGLFFVFIIENARSKKQNSYKCVPTFMQTACLGDPDRKVTTRLVSLKSVSSEDNALQHSIRPLAVRHGV